MLRSNRRLLLDTVSIGRFASFDTVVDNFSIAIGRKAGYKGIGACAIAIGEHAGETDQGENAIAVGSKAGVETQSTMAIAIGDTAGNKSQGLNAIAIGEKAGNENQGQYSIAIGSKAGIKDQPDYSIIITTNETEIVAKKKGLYIDPIRKFDDREARPDTVKEGNILSYNYQNDTENATKEVVTGFPRLPSYPTDAEVALAFTAAGGTLDQTAAGTMYFDSTKKKIKVYEGTKWVALADEEDLKKAMAALAAAANGASRSASGSSSSGVGGVYVAGSDESPFVTGGGGSANNQVLYMPDGSKAIQGVDYYLEYVPGMGSIGPPVFYKDISVVSVDKVSGNNEYPDPIGNNRPGYIQTTYDNGHVILEQIPVEQWNPPLAALGQLPKDQSREILQEYTTQYGIDVMVSGQTDVINSFESDTFRSFLEQKGIS